MGFQWDWLKPVVTVPYVPTLGPVHPAGLGLQLFADVIDVAGTGRFLAYDKDRRWSDTKDETVLPLDIVHQPGLTLIPTLNRRAGGTVKVHLYGDQHGALEDAAELAAKLAASNGAAKARVVSFQSPGEPARPGTTYTRVQLREFTSAPTFQPDQVQPLESHPATSSCRPSSAAPPTPCAGPKS